MSQPRERRFISLTEDEIEAVAQVVASSFSFLPEPDEDELRRARHAAAMVARMFAS